MHVHIRVVPECYLLRARDGPVSSFRLADGDATRESSGIGFDPVIGDFREMVPAVEEDTPTALRTVGEGHAIDARWVAKEVRHVRTIGGVVERNRDNASAGNGSSILHSFRQDRNARAFVGSHERRFLQQFRNISIEGGIPADQGLKRYWIHLTLHRRITGVRAVWIVPVRRADQTTV